MNRPSITIAAVSTALLATFGFQASASASLPAVPNPTPSTHSAPARLAPYGETFSLHSRPGSKRVLYLDFGGGLLEHPKTAMDLPRGGYYYKPYDTDGNPNWVNKREATVIQRAWGLVAQDFAPFDVDVTTEMPPYDYFYSPDVEDPEYVAYRAIVTNSVGGPAHTRGAGYAIMGSFGSGTDDPAFVFHKKLKPGWVAIGNAITHEVGHGLALDHDGIGGSEYFWGNRTWAPVMGYPGRHWLAQFSNGSYRGGNEHEDDISVIAKTLPLLPDDQPDTTATATLESGVAMRGMIGKPFDVDAYQLSVPITMKVAFAAAPDSGVSPTNLDVRIVVHNASGNKVFDSAYPGSRNAGGETVFAAGDYTVEVMGSGDRGFNAYGSLGAYKLTATLTAPGR